MPEDLVGTVIHFFKGPSVAMVQLTAGELAVAAAGGSDLPTDLGYEQPPTPPAAATSSIFS